jgi:hypothetical protein
METEGALPVWAQLAAASKITATPTKIEFVRARKVIPPLKFK